MSGPTVKRALRTHFETIRATELERLDKKVHGLSSGDRRSVEAINADVILAIARIPAGAIDQDTPPCSLEALVRLVELEGV